MLCLAGSRQRHGDCVRGADGSVATPGSACVCSQQMKHNILARTSGGMASQLRRCTGALALALVLALACVARTAHAAPCVCQAPAPCQFEDSVTCSALVGGRCSPGAYRLSVPCSSQAASRSRVPRGSVGCSRPDATAVCCAVRACLPHLPSTGSQFCTDVPPPTDDGRTLQRLRVRACARGCVSSVADANPPNPTATRAQLW